MDQKNWRVFDFKRTITTRDFSAPKKEPQPGKHEVLTSKDWDMSSKDFVDFISKTKELQQKPGLQ